MPYCPSVAAYFRQKFGAALEADADPTDVNDPSHSEFTIDTECGNCCRVAMDAFAAMLALADQHSPRMREIVVDAARNVVLCYVYE